MLLFAVFLSYIEMVALYKVNSCSLSLGISSLDSLSRFQDSINLDSSIITAYCNDLPSSVKQALKIGSSSYDIPKLEPKEFSALNDSLLFSFTDSVVGYFTNEQIAAVMESESLGTVPKADLLSRNWVNADIQGVLDKSKTSNIIWSKKVIKSSILYQTSHYKIEGQHSECFWARGFRRENSLFDDDIRIQNIEGATVEMIDTFAKCGVTFHLVAWGKLSQKQLEKPKCRRLISVSKEKRLTTITSKDNDVFSFQCMNLKDIQFENQKMQLWRIGNVKNVDLPMFLGSQILFQNIKYLDPQYSTNDLEHFFKYTTIKELEALLSDYYLLRNYNSNLLVPFAISPKMFHQSFAAFTHIYQRSQIETLNFPALFSPEWIIQMIRESSHTHEIVVPTLNPKTRLTTPQKRALLFAKVSIQDITANGDGLPAKDFETLEPSLISGVPREILQKSSETIFKSSSALSVKKQLKSAVKDMNTAQKLTILDLCESILGNDCMTQNAPKIGLEFFDVMSLDDFKNRLKLKNRNGFSFGLGDLGVYKYQDGTYQINHRDLIEFSWSQHNLIAIMEAMKIEIGTRTLLKSESIESLGNLALGILPEDIMRYSYMKAFDLIEVFTNRKLITPGNVRVFAKKLQISLDQLFAPNVWYFTSLPEIFIEIFDGFVLSQISMEKWKTLETIPTIDGTVNSSVYRKKSTLCRELVAKISGSHYLPYMEDFKKSNIANFYLLNCRYDNPIDQSEGLIQSDLDILQTLVCHIDHSVFQKTESNLLKQNIHLFQNCCLTEKQSTALRNLIFEGETSRFMSELSVDHYRVLVSLGESIFDILGSSLKNKLDNSKDAVLEIYQNSNYAKRIEKCSKIMNWSEDNFNAAFQQTDNFAQAYLAETTNRVKMPCFSSVSQASDALSQSYVTGMENNLEKIPAKCFSKWASDCEIRNSLEFLGRNQLTYEQMNNLKGQIDDLFIKDSSYKPLAIPSYNRLGSLLQIYSPNELRHALDFSDSDTISELGSLNFWLPSQSRQILEGYLYETYGPEATFGTLTKVDIAILGSFLCSLTEIELQTIDKKVLVNSIHLFGQISCLEVPQKQVLLKKYLSDKQPIISPADISLLGNIVSVFDHSCCNSRYSEFLTPNNVNSFKASAFGTLSELAISEILSGRSPYASSEFLSDYVTLEQLHVIKKRFEKQPDSELFIIVNEILNSGDQKTYKHEIFIPEIEKNSNDDDEIYDENSVIDNENSVHEYSMYSNVIYITAGSKNNMLNLILFFLLLTIKTCIS